MKYAERMNRLGSETAFKVLKKISELPAERRNKIISFAIGEPDFNTPEHIKKAGIKAIKENQTHYNPSAGILELRTGIAKFVSDTKRIKVDFENIVVLPSAKYVVDLAILSCTNPRDEIIYPNPGYPIYESLINAHDCIAKPILLKETEDWNFSVENLEDCISKKTKMIILNSPQNPTGAVISDKVLKYIAKIAEENDIWVLSDEIYSNIVYDDLTYNSIATLPNMQEKTIILDGFSKFFAMTGWRLGYAIVNKTLAEYISRWATNTISCTATFTQLAGIAAMEEDKTPSLKMVEEFERRRDLIYERLNKMDGISAVKPKGAFYIFANTTKACEKLNLKSSVDFQEYLLEKANIAVLSRQYFGDKPVIEQEKYVRFSYCVAYDQIIEGMNRMESILE